MLLEPMYFITNTYCATGTLFKARVKPASLGNHLLVALDWSKHHKIQRQKQMLRMWLRVLWIMVY